MGENYRKYSNIFGDQIAGNAAFQKVAKVRGRRGAGGHVGIE